MAEKKGGIGRAVVWVILGFVIVGLAGFGTGNFGGTVDTVAAVGQSDVRVTTYARALREELRRQGEARGAPLGFAEAQAEGIDRAVLSSLLEAAALDEAARLAGLSVGDQRVGKEILSVPAFTAPDGSFDRTAYEFALDQAGLSVSEFEEQIRDEMARGLLQTALVGGLAPPPAYAEALAGYWGERRSVRFAPVTTDVLEDPVPEVDTQAARAFWEANPDRFTRPPARAITYAWLTPAHLAEQVEIPQADLRAEYEARIDRFVQPERRLVERLAFADDAAARAAMAAIESGATSFDSLLAERDLTPEDVDLGAVTEAELGAAGAPVFALEDPGVAGPAASPVGPALFRVNAILNAQETGFEQAAPELREELALDRAAAILDDELEPLEDLLAGGLTLEELAAESEMRLGSLDWTGPGTGIAAYAAFNEAAAAVSADDFPEILRLDGGGLFALRLDAEIPAEVQPFDEVADEAREAAREAARSQALADRAEALAEALRAGSDFADLGLPAETRTGITRRGVVEALPPGGTEQVFEMAEGEIAVIAGGAEVALARVVEIAPPDPADAEAALLRDAMTQAAAQSMASEVLRALARQVQAEAGITVDQAALNAVHSRMP